MRNTGLNEIREKFLAFFELKEHLRLKSFSLVPQNDKSLLIINSGMAPLKPYFTGQEIPPSKRIATCQKCIRTGDIENVGKTARHGTFFEMLGNFSFGNYFKEEIIPWAWEFITKTMEMPADKLYVTVYQDDNEAYDIWEKKVGVPTSRIFRLGKEDNFWEVGLGPCGPCSEIYFDRGPSYGCEGFVESITNGEDRYLEFWNLVFTQFNKNEDGSYSKLKATNIDTGMGLERISAIMQGVNSIFDIDTIKAIRDEVCRISSKTYGINPKHDISIRIITDHVRSITFMSADGILPSNEGRGYVLRRLLRRAARHGKLIDINTTFLTELSKVVIRESGQAYPEILEKQDYIFKLISVEENRFYETLDAGMALLKSNIKTLKAGSRQQLTGVEAFKLYDTYGFPLELMEEILEEEGLKLDTASFHEEMEKQRIRGRNAREESTYMGADETVYNKLDPKDSTKFTGYENTDCKTAKITAVIIVNEIVDSAKSGDEVSIVTDMTPVYAESGGQQGDAGIIKTETGSAVIYDCKKVTGNKFAHIGKVISGEIKKDQSANIEIDKSRRMDTARNHSATHLLQKALREVLGNHVEQAGSYVTNERLRFDFTHFTALTKEELLKIEDIVNEKILDALEVSVKEMSIDDARKTGAMALFGEKYGETVRVVRMGDFSVELCGGTHLTNTSQAGVFRILSENGIAAGVRRIEALTGKNALAYYRELENKLNAVCGVVKAAPDNIIKRVESLITQTKDLNRELEKLRSKSAGNLVDDILSKKENKNGIDVASAILDNTDINDLRTISDKLRDKIQSGVIIIAGGKDGKFNMIVAATDDVVAKGIHCGNIIKKAAAVAGGNGGGKPNMAQAGLGDSSKVREALETAKEL